MPYDGHTSGTFTPHGHNGFPTYPDGLLRTSVPQQARFLAMFSSFGKYDHGQLLASATVTDMRRVQPLLVDDNLQGLIWYYDSYGFHTHLLGHDGDDPGTSSLMFFDPTDNAGALLVANGLWVNDNDDSPAADALLAKLFDESSNY
jgi:hypothetical protein